MSEKILIIDTSTEACSAALTIDGHISAQFEVAPRIHTKLILPMIDHIMTQAKITVNDLTAIAWGRGPGSFRVDGGKFEENLRKIFGTFEENVRKFFKFSTNFLQISSNFPQILNFPQIFFKFSTKFSQIFLQFLQISSFFFQFSSNFLQFSQILPF